MFKIMLDSDIAVSAAGQTIFELAHVGVPTIAISIADNQKNNLTGWLKEEFLLAEYTSQTVNLENRLQLTFNAYKKREQRIKFATLGKKRVDGLGAKRIVQSLVDTIISKNQGFYFRAAILKDVNNIFNLANERIVRLNSINQSPIVWKEHVDWYNKKIADPNTIFKLAFNSADEFIGQVRFDIKENFAIISLALNKDFRGKGLSAPMITTASSKCFGERKEVDYILAHINPKNIPSIKSFTSANYVLSHNETIDDEKYLVYKMIRKK
jgi:RimJ/RimL family protein N-acetyltransferase